jgi:hypothetical protein
MPKGLMQQEMPISGLMGCYISATPWRDQGDSVDLRRFFWGKVASVTASRQRRREPALKSGPFAKFGVPARQGGEFRHAGQAYFRAEPAPRVTTRPAMARHPGIYRPPELATTCKWHINQRIC